MTDKPQSSLTDDLNRLFAGQKAALNAMSDEIARMSAAIRQAEAERDAARADAERLTSILGEVLPLIEFASHTSGKLHDIFNRAVAAHAAASGKQVTP